MAAMIASSDCSAIGLFHLGGATSAHPINPPSKCIRYLGISLKFTCELIELA